MAAISQTLSSNPSDWLFQPYQNDFSHINQNQTSPTNTVSSAAATGNATSRNLSPEQGRVAKPIRRRSRASRRTPTTLLNTDTTNFRAMVQHFTGGRPASVSFAARPQEISNNRGGTAATYMDHVAAAAAPPGGFHMQYENQVQQQQQHMFVMENVHGGGGGAAAGSGNWMNYDNSFML